MLACTPLPIIRCIYNSPLLVREVYPYGHASRAKMHNAGAECVADDITELIRLLKSSSTALDGATGNPASAANDAECNSATSFAADAAPSKPYSCTGVVTGRRQHSKKLIFLSLRLAAVDDIDAAASSEQTSIQVLCAAPAPSNSTSAADHGSSSPGLDWATTVGAHLPFVKPGATIEVTGTVSSDREKNLLITAAALRLVRCVADPVSVMQVVQAAAASASGPATGPADATSKPTISVEAAGSTLGLQDDMGRMQMVVALCRRVQTKGEQNAKSRPNKSRGTASVAVVDGKHDVDVGSAPDTDDSAAAEPAEDDDGLLAQLRSQCGHHSPNTPPKLLLKREINRIARLLSGLPEVRKPRQRANQAVSKRDLATLSDIESMLAGNGWSDKFASSFDVTAAAGVDGGSSGVAEDDDDDDDGANEDGDNSSDGCDCGCDAGTGSNASHKPHTGALQGEGVVDTAALGALHPRFNAPGRFAIEVAAQEEAATISGASATTTMDGHDCGGSAAAGNSAAVSSSSPVPVHRNTSSRSDRMHYLNHRKAPQVAWFVKQIGLMEEQLCRVRLQHATVESSSAVASPSTAAAAGPRVPASPSPVPFRFRHIVDIGGGRGDLALAVAAAAASASTGSATIADSGIGEHNSAPGDAGAGDVSLPTLVTVIDINQPSLDAGAARARSLGLTNIRFVCGDVREAASVLGLALPSASSSSTATAEVPFGADASSSSSSSPSSSQHHHHTSSSAPAAPDLFIGLHACGPLSDCILTLAHQYRSSFLVCPCCFGKHKWLRPEGWWGEGAAEGAVTGDGGGKALDGSHGSGSDVVEGSAESAAAAVGSSSTTITSSSSSTTLTTESIATLLRLCDLSTPLSQGNPARHREHRLIQTRAMRCVNVLRLVAVEKHPLVQPVRRKSSALACPGGDGPAAGTAAASPASLSLTSFPPSFSPRNQMLVGLRFRG